MSKRIAASPLVGHYFHTYDKNNSIDRQGRVVGHPRRDVYLVEFHSWIMGEATGRKLVTLDQMIAEKWSFYATDGEFKDAYEYRNVHGHPDRRDDGTLMDAA